jgi:murein DD-endopeptidase MepM/ murein hydrolase activator NlpD
MTAGTGWGRLLVCLAVVLATGVGVSAAAPGDVRERADGRFWTDDTSFYRSPWFSRAHRIMIPFGCTKAPYYSPDPRCRYPQGFHHGIDLAMRCGTRIFSDVRGRVVRPTSPGSLGSAYGPKAFRIRHQGHDFVFGHVQRALVHSGDRVRRGQQIARAGDLGAPDGCHLHFEVRPARGGYSTAVAPRSFLHLHRAR